MWGYQSSEVGRTCLQILGFDSIIFIYYIYIYKYDFCKDRPLCIYGLNIIDVQFGSMWVVYGSRILVVNAQDLFCFFRLSSQHVATWNELKKIISLNVDHVYIIPSWTT